MDTIEAIVIGAGVVGLAVARALARQGVETIVLERHDRPGQETTSRNSGVIHSGIYYPTGSMKALLCVRGRNQLYAFCAERGIAHNRCGKIIVAGAAEVPALRALQAKAIANGVNDLVMLDGQQVRELEPQVRCAAGLLSPSTGIVDVHELLLALIADLEASGGALVLQSRVEEAEVTQDGFVLTVTDGDGSASTVACKHLLNCAGLAALALLGRIRGYPREKVRTPYYAKGNYFACHGVKPFKHLVYPMPNNAGLGVHATLDLDGTTRFGPDVEWVDQPEYSVDARRADSFYAAIREYWPTIPQGSLRQAGRQRGRLRDRGSSAARGGWLDQSPGHRVARPDVIARHRRARCRAPGSYCAVTFVGGIGRVPPLKPAARDHPGLPLAENR
jgi:L-2-hydroxyglutarate oxidase LhgO